MTVNVRRIGLYVVELYIILMVLVEGVNEKLVTPVTIVELVIVYEESRIMDIA
jgi:hypothetical protein